MIPFRHDLIKSFLEVKTSSFRPISDVGIIFKKNVELGNDRSIFQLLVYQTKHQRTISEFEYGKINSLLFAF